MKRFRFYVGQERDKNSHQFSFEKLNKAKELVENALNIDFGGFTKFSALSGWRNQYNINEKELNAVYEVMTHKDNTEGETFAQFMAQAFDQREVLFTSENIYAKGVTQ